MSPTERGAADLLPRPPYERLREQLLEKASARERDGDPEGAAAMRSMVDGWWNEQEQWNTRVRDVLGVHHEINNALVGVRGNAQLMLINMAGQTPAVRERLEVVLRESGRIQEATVRLRELRQVLGSPVPRPHAA